MLRASMGNNWERLFGSKDQTHSFITIEVNRFIYGCNHRGESLAIAAFRAQLRSTRDLEFCIAQENDRLSKHNSKWSLISSML